MEIIDNRSLLSQQQLDLLKQCAAVPFYLDTFGSIDNILTKLKVDVIIEPGIVTRSIPRELEEAESYWNWKKRENIDDIEEIEHNLRIISQNLVSWQYMPLRGLYDPEKNQIKLFPEEMQQEYGGQKMDELLVSTLVHETMHAYFNRPRHKRYPYVPFVEEPLAEFGMLLYLKETQSSYYDWAYSDVNSKKTCYKYGATLMDQHLKECYPSEIQEYLLTYKTGIDLHTMPITRAGEFVLPLTENETREFINGQTIIARWRNIKTHHPSFFYNEETKTLGLDGDWAEEYEWLDNSPYLTNLWELYRQFTYDESRQDNIQHLYLGDNFYICHPDNWLIPHYDVIVSPMNSHFYSQDGIPISKEYKEPFLDKISDGLYEIWRNGKCGLIDEQLNMVLSIEYDDISINKDGTCIVNKDGVESVIQLIYRNNLQIE